MCVCVCVCVCVCLRACCICMRVPCVRGSEEKGWGGVGGGHNLREERPIPGHLAQQNTVERGWVGRGEVSVLMKSSVTCRRCRSEKKRFFTA